MTEFERPLLQSGNVFHAAFLLRSAVTGLMLLASGCDRAPSAIVAPHPVSVETLAIKHMSVHVVLPGRVSARRVAEVRPQVSGILLARQFTEGEMVRAGTILYQIDPAPYQAALTEARGNLARSQAAATQAHRTAARYRALPVSLISPQDVDQADAQARQADAQVLVDSAAVNRAQINLNYTDVRAPVDGVTGKSFFTEGALVTDGQSQPLTVIQQLDPVFVDLTEDSDAWLNLQHELHYGTITATPGRAVPVTVTVGERLAARTVTCSLLFSDVTVDITTGSLVLRAQCPNPDRILLPGMYVRSIMSPGIRENALLVPQQAVSRTSDGQATVMVVDADSRAQLRHIRVADATGDRWRVTDGLSAGERVVVTGQLMLRPGMPVKVTASYDAGHPADESSAAKAAAAGTRKEKVHA